MRPLCEKDLQIEYTNRSRIDLIDSVENKIMFEQLKVSSLYMYVHNVGIVKINSSYAQVRCTSIAIIMRAYCEC